MHAHTDAIRAYGTTHTDLGADLAAAATVMSTVSASVVADAFGPVGARFAAALADATTDLARRLSVVGDDMTSAGGTTARAAGDYESVDRYSRTRLDGIGA